jgi:hypothetical protein
MSEEVDSNSSPKDWKRFIAQPFQGQYSYIYIVFLSLNLLDWLIFTSIYDRSSPYKYGWNLIFLTTIHGYAQTLYWICCLLDNWAYLPNKPRFPPPAILIRNGERVHKFRDSYFCCFIVPFSNFVGIVFLALVHEFGNTSLMHWRMTYQHVFVMIFSWIELVILQHKYNDSTRRSLFLQSLTPVCIGLVYLIWNLTISQYNNGYPYAFQPGLGIVGSIIGYPLLLVFLWGLFYLGHLITSRLGDTHPPDTKYCCCWRGSINTL